MVWNGRVVLLYWVGEENGHIHRRCTLVNRDELPMTSLVHPAGSADSLRPNHGDRFSLSVGKTRAVRN